jgi:Phage tail tube protein
MPVVAETKAERFVYKLYTDPLIQSQTVPDPLTDPGTNLGQVLRYLSHDLQLTKDQYRPTEMRQDRQRPMGSDGSRTIAGTIKGYLSAGTQQDLFAAIMRNNWTAGSTASNTELTSVAFSKSGKTITFGGGDPITEGFSAGQVIAVTGITGLNLNQRFSILGFSGTSHRVVSVFPAPAEDLAAATTFSIGTVGKTIVNPNATLDFVNYKFALEVYNPETDLARLYTECRVGSMDLDIPVNDNPKLDFGVMGRGRHLYKTTEAPFFTGPADETSSDIPTAMDGLLIFNGAPFGVATSVKISVKLNPQPAKVINPQGLVAAIFLEDFLCDGTFAAYVDDTLLFDLHADNTEFGLLIYLPAQPSSASTAATTFFLPRIRILTLQEQDSAGGKMVNCTFEAARYFGTAPGVPSTTLQISDTNVTP